MRCTADPGSSRVVRVPGLQRTTRCAAPGTHDMSEAALRSFPSLRRLGLDAPLHPIVGCLFRARERVRGLEARRHRRIRADENLVVLDAERAQPALLAHG